MTPFDILVIVVGWVLIGELVAIGVLCANSPDPFDDQPFGCQNCTGVWNTRAGFDAHECERVDA